MEELPPQHEQLPAPRLACQVSERLCRRFPLSKMLLLLWPAWSNVLGLPIGSAMAHPRVEIRPPLLRFAFKKASILFIRFSYRTLQG